MQDTHETVVVLLCPMQEYNQIYPSAQVASLFIQNKQTWTANKLG